MADNVNLRTYLASRTTIDCDTLNPEVPTTLGPFQDCTSNQAILFGELALGKHHDLIQRSIEISKQIKDKFPDVSQEELAVDLCAVGIHQLISVNISGYVHLQVNPFHSYSTEKIVTHAKRFVALCDHISPKLDPSRLCIKIPSTWEGISACRILEASGIRTLATTLFSMEQAAYAGEAGCLYIAPYVLELRVHFDTTFQDPAPNFHLCREAQAYYKAHGLGTKVLAASLQTVDELTQLAGIDHITISKPLLEALGTSEASQAAVAERSVFNGIETDALPVELKERWTWITEEDRFRIGFTRRENGRAEIKQIYAINKFCDFQVALEEMIREFK